MRLAGLETPAGPGHDAWFDVVGVVADVKNGGVGVPIEPEVWMPYTIAGMGQRNPVLLVRTSQDPGTVANAVRREVWATDLGVALLRPSALADGWGWIGVGLQRMT